MTRFEEIKDWLESHKPKAELEPEEQQALRELLGSPGLGALISLMLGSRDAQLLALVGISLSSNELVARASVIQGTIKGIELFRETLLEQSVPATAEEGARTDG